MYSCRPPGADLQYRLVRFFAGSGPPPLEEVFFATQNLSRATQEQVMSTCPGLLVCAFILLAEMRLPVSPREAADAIAKADSLAAALSWDAYEAEAEAWPIQQAMDSYQEAASAIEVAAARPAPSAQLVVAHCRESLGWLVDGRLYVPPLERLAVDLFVYEKCGQATDIGALSRPFRQVQTKQVDDGDLRTDECSAYLHHVIDHYDGPHDYTLFFQADAEDHLQWGYLALVLRAIEHRSLTAGFVHLDYPRLVSSLSRRCPSRGSGGPPWCSSCFPGLLEAFRRHGWVSASQRRPRWAPGEVLGPLWGACGVVSAGPPPVVPVPGGGLPAHLRARPAGDVGFLLLRAVRRGAGAGAGQPAREVRAHARDAPGGVSPGVPRHPRPQHALPHVRGLLARAVRRARRPARPGGQPRLPLCLRTRDLESESYLPGGSFARLALDL
ncbi:unnamed protein product [Prorocentrum cordatum]|uniref:Uncharacterized protein n=1 Tax=Prorocentrum cordatum TaxID=2364126 RepID=A0ABN9Y0C4_9DINO|nr:unnamed protein product [Polarella glacialis]